METIWVARDRCGALYLYETKPSYNSTTGNFEVNGFVGELNDVDNCGCMSISKDRFPEVTFENSPVELNFILKNDYEQQETRLVENI